MQVIVLGGMGRVGKTDVADWIVEAAQEDGMNPVRLSFADPLKKQAAADAGYGDDWRKYKAEKPEDYRQVCQDLGASRRAEDPDYWVNLWKMQLADMAKAELEADNEEGIWEETVVVVDDCRYPNEVEAARQFEALTMFVYAGGREIPESEAAWRAHESEEMSQRIEGGDLDGSDYFDWALVNSGSVDDLDDKLEKRRHYLTGLAPNRFGNSCQCGECATFRFDIQNTELIESIEAAMDTLLGDDDLSEEQKAIIEAEFDEMIEDLKNGDINVDDFFGKYWKGDKDEHDDDADDSSA